MNIRRMIDDIAQDFVYVCIIQTINGIDTIYNEQYVYRNHHGDGWPYVFYPCNERAIDFDVDHITRIVITPNDMCIHIKTP